MAGSMFVQFTPEMGSETISYKRDVQLIEFSRYYQPHGLIFDAAWIWGVIEEKGPNSNNGQRYFFCREYKKANTNFVFINKIIPDLEHEDEPMFVGELYQGYTYNNLLQDQQKIVMGPAYPIGSNFKIEIAEKKVTYLENDGKILALDFEWLAPALVFYVPGQAGQENDIMYQSQHYTIEGTFNGKTVFGWGGIDQAWVPPFQDYRQSKIYNCLEGMWPVWYNEYEDGSREYGVYVDGMYGHQAAIVMKNGITKAIKQTSVEDVMFDQNGMISSFVMKLDEYNFKWEALSRCVIGATAKADDHSYEIDTTQLDDADWIIGKVTNLDEKRKPVLQFNNTEIFTNRVKRRLGLLK
jgi:hypothetical protein